MKKSSFIFILFVTLHSFIVYGQEMMQGKDVTQQGDDFSNGVDQQNTEVSNIEQKTQTSKEQSSTLQQSAQKSQVLSDNPQKTINQAQQQASTSNVEELSEPEKFVKNFKTSLIVYYSTANTVEFDNSVMTDYSLGSFDGSVTYNTKSAFGLGISLAHIPVNNWGFMGSMLYEMERKIDTMRVSLKGYGTAVFDTDSKYSSLLLEVGTVYRQEQVYFPINLNYSIPFVQDGGTMKVSSSGDVGLSAGGGLFINEQNSIEMLFRLVRIKMTGADGSESYDFGTGYSKGLAIAWKYWLK